MSRYSGVVLDFHDDNGQHFKTRFPSVDDVPDIIKEADIRSPEDLPNEAFALVAVDGGEMLRKYACYDPGTTSMSVVYFMDHGHKLPESAVKVAAANLAEACLEFDIVPPADLIKMAGPLSRLKDVLGEAGKAALEATKGELGEAARTVAKHMAIGGTTGAAAGLAAGAAVDDARRGAGRGMLGGAVGGALGGALAGKSVPLGAMAGGLLGGAAGGGLFGEKTASAVDITGQAPSPKVASVRPITEDDYAVVMDDGSRYYPINTWDRVKTAEEYWLENKIRMEPAIRRQFAEKLAAKSVGIGYPLDEQIKEAGSQTFAHPGHIKASLEMRKVAFAPESEDREFLDELFEKRASLGPSMFAECLRRFDIQHDLDAGYDQFVLNNFESTYGFDKLASDVVWEHGADRLTRGDLQNIATNHIGGIHELYGSDMAKEFAQDPEGVFGSMPLPQQRIIARLATDMSASGRTEIQPQSAGGVSF